MNFPSDVTSSREPSPIVIAPGLPGVRVKGPEAEQEGGKNGGQASSLLVPESPWAPSPLVLCTGQTHSLSLTPTDGPDHATLQPTRPSILTGASVHQAPSRVLPALWVQQWGTPRDH